MGKLYISYLVQLLTICPLIVHVLFMVQITLHPSKFHHYTLKTLSLEPILTKMPLSTIPVKIACTSSSISSLVSISCLIVLKI